jgi:hypothetical protein
VHVGIARGERIDEVRADETRTPGDDGSHRDIS